VPRYWWLSSFGWDMAGKLKTEMLKSFKIEIRKAESRNSFLFSTFLFSPFSMLLAHFSVLVFQFLPSNIGRVIIRGAAFIRECSAPHPRRYK
jgi:hypothetical protein